MPTVRLSSTRTGIGESFAASSADSSVADSSAEMCSETTPSAPRTAAAR